jgi:hypothetical protein
MSDKKLDEELLAMLANTRMEERQSYVARGRHMHAEDTETLISNWLVQINAWADDKHDFELRLIDDIEAELGLRGINAPVHEARDAIKKIKTRARAVGDRWRSNPEEMQKVEDHLQAELAKVRPSKADKN